MKECPFCGVKPIIYMTRKKDNEKVIQHPANGCFLECLAVELKKWNTRTPIVQQSLSGSDESSPKSCANCFWNDKNRMSACNGCYDEGNWEKRT